uniref:Uncharacterized protein n=1 Tax=Nelumbo nucifera TaxID=4432 RepID=A0A822ZLV1_NELNU|nr:TPA_asm: hypothetical protein HUJ06_004402 [Nelumbo nucifera]
MKNKWFKQNISCQYLDEPSTQYSLTLDRFRGLFLLAGVVSTSSLIIFLGSFLHEYYHMFTNAGSKVPTWQRLVDMFKYFDQKRTSSNNGVQ